MTLSITPVTILDNKTIAASCSTVLDDCTAVPGAALTALGIEFVMTFDAAATAGATVKVFSSRNGTNFTTRAIYEYDVPVTAGAEIRDSFVLLPGHSYYRVQIENLDSAQSITGIFVYSEPQVLS